MTDLTPSQHLDQALRGINALADMCPSKKAAEIVAAFISQHLQPIGEALEAAEREKKP